MCDLEQRKGSKRNVKNLLGLRMRTGWLFFLGSNLEVELLSERVPPAIGLQPAQAEVFHTVLRITGDNNKLSYLKNIKQI